MAKITIDDGALGSVIRAAINDMFTELYGKFQAATALVDGYLKHEDFDTFNKKQDALTDPVTLVAVPATASSSGTKGQIAIDAEYLYLCTATDTWVRAAVVFATWGA